MTPTRKATVPPAGSRANMYDGCTNDRNDYEKIPYDEDDE